MPTYTVEQIAAAKALVAADARRDEVLADEPEMSAAWEQWNNRYRDVYRAYEAADKECIRLFGWGVDPAELRRIAAVELSPADPN